MRISALIVTILHERMHQIDRLKQDFGDSVAIDD